MKKVFWILTLALSVPAFAQRGGPVKPPTNQAIACASDVSEGSSCSGYERTWCVNYDTNIIYACDPNTHVWDAVGSGGGGGSGGTTITVISNSSQTFSSVDTLDFNSDFGLSDQGGGNVLIGVNDANIVPVMTNATGTLDVSHGGTSSTTSAAARSALGAAGSGINVDITALTALAVPLSPSQGGTGLSNSTGLTNQVAVGATSTALAYLTIPDCNATGNQLGFEYSGGVGAWECAADGAGGSGIEASEEGSDVTAAARSRINFAGAAFVTATDDAGNSRVNVTFSVSPDSASAVGTGRTLTGGTGLSAIGDLSANRTLSVDSTEAAFLTDRGASAVSAGAGAAGVLDSGPITYMDGAGVAQLTALGNSAGAALTGADAATFFPTGILPVADGGTGVATLGTTTWCLYNNGGTVGSDGGCTFSASTDTLTVGTLVATGAADLSRYLELQRNSSDVGTPLSGFGRIYAAGTAGSERPKWRTFTGGIEELASLTAAGTITNKVIAGASNDLSFRFHATDCTANTDGVHGEPCYEVDADTIYVCEATGGAGNICDTVGEWKSTGAAAVGDITDVMDCSSGNCEDIVAGAADSLDMSAGQFLRIPIDNTIDTAGKIGVDTTTTLDQLQVFMGGAVRAFSPVRSAGAVLEALVAGDDDYEFFMAPENVTIVGVACHCRVNCGTLATFTLQSRAGTGMTITGTNPTCSTTTGDSTFAAVTANNTLTTGQGLQFDVTNTPTASGIYTITVQYVVTPQ